MQQIGLGVRHQMLAQILFAKSLTTVVLITVVVTVQVSITAFASEDAAT